MWGILAAVFNSIPYLGPVIVAARTFVAGGVHDNDLAQALLRSCIALAINLLEGWLITLQ